MAYERMAKLDPADKVLEKTGEITVQGIERNLFGRRTIFLFRTLLHFHG